MSSRQLERGSSKRSEKNPDGDDDDDSRCPFYVNINIKVLVLDLDRTLRLLVFNFLNQLVIMWPAITEVKSVIL